MIHQTTVTEPAGRLAPVAPGERIDLVDVLRGFALFGILAVNMEFFFGSVWDYAAGLRDWPNPIDQAAEFLILFLGQGKFYSIFSLLFGLGFAIQFGRAEAKQQPFAGIYLRRSLVLLAIGLIHAVFFWVGDILVTYALLGLVLLLFRRVRPGWLLATAGLAIVIPILLIVLVYGFTLLAMAIPEAAPEIERQLASQQAFMEEQAALAARDYREAGFFELPARRLADLAFTYTGQLFVFPTVFAMFLLGLYSGKRGWFSDVRAHLALFRRLFWIGLPVGLALNLVIALIFTAESRVDITVGTLLATTLGLFAPQLLALGYVAGLTLLFQQPAGRSLLAPLAPLGRMALTNYLLQTLIVTTLAYGYGFGLYGQVGPAAAFGLTIVIYAVQIVVSLVWLRFFRFGPVEWLWRSLTYLRPQPWRA